MNENYQALGLNEGASEEEVLQAYRELAYRYNPDHYSDPFQKEDAARRLEEVNRAFDRIMNYMRRGTIPEDGYMDEGRQFYLYIRRLIQQGRYDTAINQLTAYNNEDEAQWQFLMGSALYYGGYISRSYEHFALAADMEPDNEEYTSVFSRMTAARNGNFNSSPFNLGDMDVDMAVCGDPCTVCQCLICLNCLKH